MGANCGKVVAPHNGEFITIDSGNLDTTNNIKVSRLQVDTEHYIADYSHRNAFLTFAINDQPQITHSTHAYQNSYSRIFQKLTFIQDSPFNLIWNNDGKPFIFYQPNYRDYGVLFDLNPIESDTTFVGSITPQTNTITFYPTDFVINGDEEGNYDFYSHLLEYNGLPRDAKSISITSNFIGEK